jgi:hypothetical protein
MLRDLAAVIEDLHEGLQRLTLQRDVRLLNAQMTLPVDSALALKDGGCALLLDVSRNFADAPWRSQTSRLTLEWRIERTEWLP